MQLEKATSHSGEAGLAGWISSNDVTLFTVVLFVVIAIFLQSNLIKGSKKNEQLASANLSLNELARQAQAEVARQATELKDTNEKLEQVRSQLTAASDQLTATKQELEQRLKELEATKARLADTDHSLQTTRQAKDALEQQRQKLAEQVEHNMAAITELNRQLAALKLEKTTLTETSERLAGERTMLQQKTEELRANRDKLDVDLATLTAQLQQKLQQLTDLQRERDLLDQQTKALTERVQRLEQQLGTSEKTLADVKQSSQTELESLKQLLARALERQKQDQAASAGQLKGVQTQAQEATARAEDYLDRLHRAAALFKDMDENKKLLQLQIEALKTQLANALDDLQEAETRIVQQQTREKTINRELVGLRGNLKRVAILFDSSGSMTQGGRWEEVQRIAATWLEHLEVDQCVLIVFSSDVRTFPEDGSMLTVRGPEGPASRAKMTQFLRGVKPEGWTDTLAAMQKAYSYPQLDTIILFSDGAPTYASSNQFNAPAVEQIYTLCRRRAEIPVNAVGLGNYFDQQFSTFLRTVAQLTGGTFVGR
jgi:chromosome segregation ATPase